MGAGRLRAKAALGRAEFCVLLAQEPFEQVEAIGPESLVEAQPFMRGGERPGIEAAPDGCGRAPRGG